jgi:cAMP-dependent protein kinase regulator
MGLDKEKIKNDALLYIQNGQLDKALVEYQKLVVLEAGSPDVHYELAQLYEKLNDADKASQEYMKSARIYERANEISKALELYEKSLSLNSRQKDIHKKIEELKSRSADKEEKTEKKSEKKTKRTKEKSKEEDNEEKESEATQENITIVTREEINIPLFSELNEKEFHEILAVSEKRHYDKDDIIVREGEPGESIFFIISGEVGVFKKGDKEDIWLNTLRDGEFFGEFAYFSRLARQATVIATAETDLLEMKRDALDLVSERFPNIVNVLTNFYKVRVLDTVVGLCPIFSVLQPHQRQKLISKFELAIVPKGEIIIKEGTEGTGIFLIKNGRVKLTTKTPYGDEVDIGILKEFDFFGEVSLLMGVPTTASVVADTEVRLMKLSKENFNWILDEFPFIRKRLKVLVEERAENTIGTILKLFEEKQLVGHV